MKKYILFILMITMLFAFSIQASEFDTSWVNAIKNTRTNNVYVEGTYNIAASNANSGDTFSLGEWNTETEQYRVTNNDNSILNYIGNYQREELSVQFINDEMIRKVKYHSDKLLYCLYEEIYTKNNYDKWILRFINKSVVKQ